MNTNTRNFRADIVLSIQNCNFENGNLLYMPNLKVKPKKLALLYCNLDILFTDKRCNTNPSGPHL